MSEADMNEPDEQANAPADDTQHTTELPSDRPEEPPFAFAEDDDARPGRGTHPLSVSHLVFGLVFLGGATSWWLREVDAIGDDSVRWVIPLVLVLAGTVGLVAWVAKSAAPQRR